MLEEYIQKALEIAKYKCIEDGSWYAEIDGFQGVWSNGVTVEECRRELKEVLEEWLLLKIKDGDPISSIKGVEIHIREPLTVK